MILKQRNQYPVLYAALPDMSNAAYQVAEQYCAYGSCTRASGSYRPRRGGERESILCERRPLTPYAPRAIPMKKRQAIMKREMITHPTPATTSQKSGEVRTFRSVPIFLSDFRFIATRTTFNCPMIPPIYVDNSIPLMTAWTGLIT